MEETIGAKLYALRTERGWSQALAARKLGVGRNQLGYWENERHRPRLIALEKIAAVFGVPLNYLWDKEKGVISHDNSETIGQRIQRLRIQKGWEHRTDLARVVSVSYQMVYDWETGKYNPRADDIAPLAKALGVTTDYLLTGRESALLSAIKAQIKQKAPHDRLLAMVTDYD